MQIIHDLQDQRQFRYKMLVFLSQEIKEYIKIPVQPVDVLQLQYQYSFILREIEAIDFKMKNNILLQIQNAKLDLKNLETQLSLVVQPFHVSDLPPYSSIFK